MKKRTHHRHHAAHLTHHRASSTKADRNYLVIIRGWMFLVLFALMLGIGAVVGNFLNQQLNQSTPQVAGSQISR